MAKTKADLLEELNEDLEAKNEKLVGEIRQVKSEMAQFESIRKELENVENIKAENTSLKKEIEVLESEKKYQEEQIKVLLNGLNESNVAINKLFGNLDYTLKLAQENYDKIFGNIQNELNNIKKGE